MSAKQKVRPELSLLELVEMVFAQIALDANNSGSISLMPGLSNDESRIHTFFHELKKDFGKDFEALGKLHFIESGHFPYSHDLNTALYWAKVHGSYVATSYAIFLKAWPDTEAVLKEFIDKHTSGQKRFPKRFRALVARFERLKIPV